VQDTVEIINKTSGMLEEVQGAAQVSMEATQAPALAYGKIQNFYFYQLATTVTQNILIYFTSCILSMEKLCSVKIL
jgi:hypothetical protein